MAVKLNISVLKKNGYYSIQNTFVDKKFRTLSQFNHYKSILNADYNFVLNYCIQCNSILWSSVDICQMRYYQIQDLERFSNSFFWQLKNISFRSYATSGIQFIYLEKLINSLIDFADYVGNKNILSI
ncbi:MAG: hypothetical protein QM751_06180 [Paludibacteraceae bacterium]